MRLLTRPGRQSALPCHSELAVAWGCSDQVSDALISSPLTAARARDQLAGEDRHLPQRGNQGPLLGLSLPQTVVALLRRFGIGSAWGIDKICTNRPADILATLRV